MLDSGKRELHGTQNLVSPHHMGPVFRLGSVCRRYVPNSLEVAGPFSTGSRNMGIPVHGFWTDDLLGTVLSIHTGVITSAGEYI